MQMVPFHIMNLFDDVDDKLYTFEQLFLDILDEHAPLKQILNGERQLDTVTNFGRFLAENVQMKIMSNINASVTNALPLDVKP